MKKLSLIGTMLLAITACHQQPHAVDKKHWAYYKKAYNFLGKHTDSAFYYFNRAALDTADKLQVALAYYNMALIQADAGDDYGAQESLTLSLKSLNPAQPQNRPYLATDYNKLGMTFSNLNDYTQALAYYKLALDNTDDPQYREHFLDNEGNAYKDLKAYDKALDSYHAALAIVDKTGTAYARILTNVAVAKWLQNPRYDAAPELLQSLAIRLREKDSWGRNSSYGHLTAFYMARKPDSAFWFAQKMLQVATALSSADDQRYALQKLALLAPPAAAKAYFLRYQQLTDSIEIKRSTDKNQFAVIRYNVEKASTENLELQRKNAARRYQLIAVLAAAGVSAGLGIWLYRKRRQRLQLEAENEIRENKLRLSQKVHDRVANGIYRIMSEVEHLPEIDRTVLLDRLENMYDISRDIAHDEPESDVDFAGRVSAMLHAFKQPSVRLAVTGNETDLWAAVNLHVKEQLLLVLQELMVNMSKHSQATQAFVGFSAGEGRLCLEYRDDGVGLAEKGVAGKGMQNTVSRIKALNGTISFDGAERKGLRVLIQLPMVH